MGEVDKLYSKFLSERLETLERERRKHYELFFDELVAKGMVRSDIHIEQALELEIRFFRDFTEYAIIQFKELRNRASVEIHELEEVCRYYIETFFRNSLQRMIGIINNVRSSIKEEFAIGPLEKIRSEALKKLEMAKELHKNSKIEIGTS